MDDFGQCVIRTGVEALSPKGAKEFCGLKAQIDQAMRALISGGIADDSMDCRDSFVIASRLRRGDPERQGRCVPPWIAASLRSSR